MIQFRLLTSKKVLQTGRADRTRAHVAALWANVNGPGDWNVAHQHAEDGATGEAVPRISGVYYPSLGPEDAVCKAQLQFPGCDCSPTYPCASDGCSVDPKPGMLVLFPASSLHSVAACDDSGGLHGTGAPAARISFAFNLLTRTLSSDLQAQAAAGNLSGVPPLQARADVNAKDALGFAALHHAAEAGHLAMVDLLLEQGADPMLLSGNGSLALHLALDSNNAEAATRLLEAVPSSATQAGGTGSMPAHIAAGHGNVDLLGRLLQLRADLQSKQHDGSTPLHTAVQNGHAEAVQFILQEPSVPHDAVKAADARRYQPAHEAARGGLLPILSELLSARADLKAKDDKGHSLLYWAAHGGHVQALDLLLQAGARIEDAPEVPVVEGGQRGEAMANYLAAALVGPQLDQAGLSFLRKH